jgi:hypothetical protein
MRYFRLINASNGLKKQSLLSKVLLIILDGVTKETCIGAYLFSRQVLRLVRKLGLLVTALYLKYEKRNNTNKSKKTRLEANLYFDLVITRQAIHEINLFISAGFVYHDFYVGTGNSSLGNALFRSLKSTHIL